MRDAAFDRFGSQKTNHPPISLLDTGRVDCRLHFLSPIRRDAGGLAQLVEHGIENAGVPGSSPGVAIPFRTRQDCRTRSIIHIKQHPTGPQSASPMPRADRLLESISSSSRTTAASNPGIGYE
jgi:hypothetical protein